MSAVCLSCSAQLGILETLVSFLNATPGFCPLRSSVREACLLSMIKALHSGTAVCVSIAICGEVDSTSHHSVLEGRSTVIWPSANLDLPPDTQLLPGFEHRTGLVSQSPTRSAHTCPNQLNHDLLSCSHPSALTSGPAVGGGVPYLFVPQRASAEQQT